jgi:hypothetical protein
MRVARPGVADQDGVAALGVQPAIRLVGEGETVKGGPALKREPPGISKVLCLDDQFGHMTPFFSSCAMLAR